MAKKHMKRCSTSLITKEMRIKTTVRCHYASVRRAAIQKTTRVGEDVEKLTPVCTAARECKTVQLPRKTGWLVPRKLKIELPRNPTIYPLGIDPKN